MDMEEIRYLLGGTIFARAKAYTDRIQDLNCEVAGNGVRHLSADVRGGGRSLYQTQVWLRENGSFVSASCSCPYNGPRPQPRPGAWTYAERTPS